MAMLRKIATRRAVSKIAPVRIDHSITAERDAFCDPVEGFDSGPRVDTLETDIRTLLGLGTVDAKDANSCWVAMASRFMADTESARGFVSSIAEVCALLDEVSM